MLKWSDLNIQCCCSNMLCIRYCRIIRWWFDMCIWLVRCNFRPL